MGKSSKIPEGNWEKKDYRIIPIDQIEPNEGQIEGLPSNPNYIKDEKFQELKDNISRYPKLLGHRALLVYPLSDKRFIVIGGNMRFHALQELGHTEAPCEVIDKETEVEVLRAYTMIDNNRFGKTDEDKLANEWDMEELKSWGFDTIMKQSDIDIDSYFDDLDSGGSKDKGEKITITIPSGIADKKDEVARIIKDSLADNGFSEVKVK